MLVSHKVPILIESTHKLLTVSPSNNHPKLPWRAESSSVGCDANNHSQGLLYWPNWNILCQSGEQVLRGTMRQRGTTWLRCQWLLPPASLNILQIQQCSNTGFSEADTIKHQAAYKHSRLKLYFVQKNLWKKAVTFLIPTIIFLVSK